MAAPQPPITYGVLGTRDRYDPAKYVGYSDAFFLYSVLGTLVHKGPNNEILGFLANSWKVLEGGQLYRFRLHPKAKFSDGTRITSQDVVDTFKRAILHGVQFCDIR